MGSLNWVHGTLSEPPWKSHLDKKLIHHRIGWELNPINARPNRKEYYLENDICIYINLDKEEVYNHISLWQYKTTAIRYRSSPAATYMRPGAGQQVRLPDLQRGASLAEATTGDPSAPCFIYFILYYKSRHHQCEVFRLFRSSTHTNTNIHLPNVQLQTVRFHDGLHWNVWTHLY